MRKISLITACAIALSGSAALAQGMPSGPNSGPGSAQPDNTGGMQSAPSSSSMTQQQYKETSAGQTMPARRHGGQHGTYNQQAAAPIESPQMGCGAPGGGIAWP